MPLDPLDLENALKAVNEQIIPHLDATIQRAATSIGTVLNTAIANAGTMMRDVLRDQEGWTVTVTATFKLTKEPK